MEIATQDNEQLGEISSESELNSQLNSNTNTGEVLNDDLPEIGMEQLNAKINQDNQNDGGSDGDIDDEYDEDYENIIDYLDDKHDLGLAIEELPENLSRQEEAEIISDLFEKVATNASKQLEEYAGIEALLNDDEVAAFIEAKRNGATLKDFIQAMDNGVDSLSDEEIISYQLQREYPNMTEDEISDLVDDYKDKGVLSKMSEAARTKIKQIQQYQEEATAYKEQQIYQQDVQDVANILNNTYELYGVPLTQEIKENVYAAATQRDENGMTYLDNALQTNDGVILATLGLLHLQDLMQAKASTDSNRRNKRLVEKLFENPVDLQSNSQDTSNAPVFDPRIANSF
jgi:hypothetical protein